MNATTKTERDALDAMSRARSRLLQSQPFWAVLALRLRLVTDSKCRTAWTDSVSLGFNPEWTSTLTRHHAEFVVAHEVAHNVLRHCTRRGSRDPKTWNEACDYVANLMLHEAGFSLLDGILFDRKFADMNTEQVYSALKSEEERQRREEEERRAQDPSPDESGDDEDGADDSPDSDTSDDEEDGATCQQPDEGDDDADDENADDADENCDESADDEHEDDADGTGRGDDADDDADEDETCPHGHTTDEDCEDCDENDDDAQGQGDGEDCDDDSDDSDDDAQSNDCDDATDEDDAPADTKAPTFDDVRDAPEETNDSENEATWAVATMQAARAALAAGQHVPGCVRRLVEDLTTPKVDWRSTLREALEQSAAIDYEWARPNRRMIASGIYLPSLGGKQLKRVVAFVDTSGSVNDYDTREFLSESSGIAEEFNCALTVVFADSAVRHVQEFEPGDELEYEPRGGGGTNFAPSFQWLERQDEQPSAVIYLTDLYGFMPPERLEPPCPVVWVVNSNCDYQVPFGHKVNLR